MLTLAGNHLWQSTAFAAVVLLLALALRTNHARVRYALWLTASMKFLIPFSALAWIGVALGQWLTPPSPVSRLTFVADQIAQPFTPMQTANYPSVQLVHMPAASPMWPAAIAVVWFCGFLAVLLYGLSRWSRVARAVDQSIPLVEGREFEALFRVAPQPLPGLVSSAANLEPGVFGILRPVIWLPGGIANRLDDEELEAILAHELAHIRRCDNLTAALHMAVEAIFWFHPLVWWLSARLTEERERACDDDVLRTGGKPHIYAESILKVCEFCLASPVACAVGITGGELTKRIEEIMAARLTRRLGPHKKLAIAAAAIAAIATPLVLGIANARAQTLNADTMRNAPRFDVASIKPSLSDMGGAWDFFPVNGKWTSKSMTIPNIVSYAYNVSHLRVLGVPKSLDAPAGYTIVVKMPLTTTREDFKVMMRSMLADRFNAAIHTETRDILVNTIEVAKGGVKLARASGDCIQDGGNAALPSGKHRCHEVEIHPSASMDRTETVEYSGYSISMEDLAASLSWGARAGIIVDDTGLSGLYDLDVKIVSRPGPDPIENEANWNYAWREAWAKVGLITDRAKTKKRPGTVVIVDHIEAASAN